MQSEPEARATVGRLVRLAREGELDAVAGSLSLLGYADPVRRRGCAGCWPP